jgi:hypothetical protein
LQRILLTESIHSSSAEAMLVSRTRKLSASLKHTLAASDGADRAKVMAIARNNLAFIDASSGCFGV